MKPSGIEVTGDHGAKVICSHCNDTIYMDITTFKDRTDKIMKTNCPKCNGELYIGVLILCHTSLENISQCILACMNALPGHKSIIDGQRVN